MEKKLYAWQVAPENQESPLYWGKIEDCYPEVAITGNRNYNGYIPDALKDVDMDDMQAVSDAMGEPYTKTTIHGCSQGEWQYLYYPSEWSRDNVDAIQAEYFNTGTEWLVAEETTEEELNAPDNVYTCSYYDVNNDEEAFRAMLAAEHGIDKEQVVLYAHDGYTQTAKYKVVTNA